jgi:hypothetical protein
VTPLDSQPNALTELLRAYTRREPRRVTGGLLALSGFDLQLRTALADFGAALADGGEALGRQGGVLVEAFSDYFRPDANRTVCVQVKRTLDRSALRQAAGEMAAIDAFLAEEAPDLRRGVCFEVVGSRIVPSGLDWDRLVSDPEHGSLLRRLATEGRLLPLRKVEDPWWRLIATTWDALADPFDFARFALDRLLSRGIDPADALRARNDIAERFARSRRQTAPVGAVLSPQHFTPFEKPSPILSVGRSPTLSLLRDRQYMPRSKQVAGARAALAPLLDASRPRPVVPRLEVFWIHGRSGSGKSVLLLQLLEELVRDGYRALWLGSAVDELQPLLEGFAGRADDDQLDLVLVDDLFDPDARDRLDLARLGRLIEETAGRAWPGLVTCGPPEFVSAFREDSRHRGFELNEWLLPPVEDLEAQELAAWFEKRSGQVVRRGTAFAQARAHEGLVLSLAIEAAHGDLQEFALRFRKRIDALDEREPSPGGRLAEALRLPLALGRLYLGAPYQWLAADARERLEVLNQDGDFAILDLGSSSTRRFLRLTHPHLSDALYRALRGVGSRLAYAHDLAHAFRRALDEREVSMVARLLRLFAGARENELERQRLEPVDSKALAEACLETW